MKKSIALSTIVIWSLVLTACNSSKTETQPQQSLSQRKVPSKSQTNKNNTPHFSQQRNEMTFTNFYGEYSVPMGWSRERISDKDWSGNFFVNPQDSNQHLKVTEHLFSSSGFPKSKSSLLTFLDMSNTISSTFVNDGQGLIYQLKNSNSNYVTYGKIALRDNGYKRVEFALPTSEKNIAEKVVSRFWANE